MKLKLAVMTMTLGLQAAFAQSNYPTIGSIVRNDPQLDQLLPKDAKIEVLASGFVWSEGPVWVKEKGGYLLFSDVPQNTVFKWTQKEGITSFLKPSGYTGLGKYSDEPGSNGLAIDRQGRLLSAEHGDRRISAMPLSGGGKKTLADSYQGKRLNSPNDLVAHSNGSVYFTDPPYGLPDREKDTKTRELDIHGVYRVEPDGKVTLLVGNLTRPNGVALSADEKTLYVAQSDPARAIIMSYPIQADGSIGTGRVFYDGTEAVKQGLKGVPDGLKVDKNGNVWSTGPGGLLIISPAGKLLGRISVGESTSNCAWGDDGSTLYITADMYLCRVRTTTTGAGF